MRRNSEAATAAGGTSFMTLLAVLFIALKLTGHVAWSWWWVTAPIWGGPVLLLAGLVIWIPMSFILRRARK